VGAALRVVDFPFVHGVVVRGPAVARMGEL